MRHAMRSVVTTLCTLTLYLYPAGIQMPKNTELSIIDAPYVRAAQKSPRVFFSGPQVYTLCNNQLQRVPAENQRLPRWLQSRMDIRRACRSGYFFASWDTRNRPHITWIPRLCGGSWHDWVPDSMLNVSSGPIAKTSGKAAMGCAYIFAHKVVIPYIVDSAVDQVLACTSDFGILHPVNVEHARYLYEETSKYVDTALDYADNVARNRFSTVDDPPAVRNANESRSEFDDYRIGESEYEKRMRKLNEELNSEDFDKAREGPRTSAQDSEVTQPVNQDIADIDARHAVHKKKLNKFNYAHNVYDIKNNGKDPRDSYVTWVDEGESVSRVHPKDTPLDRGKSTPIARINTHSGDAYLKVAPPHVHPVTLQEYNEGDISFGELLKKSKHEWISRGVPENEWENNCTPLDKLLPKVRTPYIDRDRYVDVDYNTLKELISQGIPIYGMKMPWRNETVDMSQVDHNEAFKETRHYLNESKELYETYTREAINRTVDDLRNATIMSDMSDSIRNFIGLAVRNDIITEDNVPTLKSSWFKHASPQDIIAHYTKLQSHTREYINNLPADEIGKSTRYHEAKKAISELDNVKDLYRSALTSDNAVNKAMEKTLSGMPKMVRYFATLLTDAATRGELFRTGMFGLSAAVFSHYASVALDPPARGGAYAFGKATEYGLAFFGL